MKKITLLLYIIAVFTACDNKSKAKKIADPDKSGKQIAEEVCDCYQKANSLAATDTTRARYQNDCSAKNKIAWDKVKDNPQKADDFNKTISVCGQEQIKKSFGQ